MPTPEAESVVLEPERLRLAPALPRGRPSCTAQALTIWQSMGR
ncbi:hypothetical protein ABZ656_07515 [Streptomyces sp. NPDC007095]